MTECLGRESHILKRSTSATCLHTDIEDPETSAPPAAPRLTSKAADVREQFSGRTLRCVRDAWRIQNHPMGIGLVVCVYEAGATTAKPQSEL